MFRSILVAALLAATSVSAQPRDPFEGPWAGDCGSGVYCELEVRRSGDAYEAAYVLEESGAQVCRVEGTFSLTGHGRLSGRLGSSAVDISRYETATDLGLALSGFHGAPCSLSRNVDGRYLWFLDE